ncbi:hypothetical protein AAG570_005386 [Ranatra chinensis]|uniref:Uncharacterized protein n=1 Tax=Ranatra chinensis TaxID=642074 RepID=A0ABD0Y0A1_9HEMI
MASKRRNMFHQNKKQETTEIGSSDGGDGAAEIRPETEPNMTPLDDFMLLINSVLLGEDPTIEDFILLVGTLVAFLAFVLWCCFPAVPKEAKPGPHHPVQYDPKCYPQYRRLVCSHRPTDT